MDPGGAPRDRIRNVCFAAGGSMTRSLLSGLLAACVALAPGAAVPVVAQDREQAVASDLLPKHVTPKSVKSVERGLAYLAKEQTADGNWVNSRDGAAYPISMAALAGMAFLANGNTTSRGPYADNVRRIVHYLLDNRQPSGIITSA